MRGEVGNARGCNAEERGSNPARPGCLFCKFLVFWKFPSPFSVAIEFSSVKPSWNSRVCKITGNAPFRGESPFRLWHRIRYLSLEVCRHTFASLKVYLQFHIHFLLLFVSRELPFTPRNDRLMSSKQNLSERFFIIAIYAIWEFRYIGSC